MAFPSPAKDKSSTFVGEKGNQNVSLNQLHWSTVALTTAPGQFQLPQRSNESKAMLTAFHLQDYLRDTVLRALRHRIGHRKVVHHHDVLIGLIHSGWRLRSGADGRATVLECGGSWRLNLRPLKKLEKGKEGGRRRGAKRPMLSQPFSKGATQFGLTMHSDSQ